MFLHEKKTTLPRPEETLPGRSEKMPVPNNHFINGHPLIPPYPEGLEYAMFGLGCFWGAERCFWVLDGVYVTAAGYAGGATANPTYEEICTGMTGHSEVVRVIFNPSIITYDRLLQVFWESHDPTQGMRQGPDVGTQYRSGIYVISEAQKKAAISSLAAYQTELKNAGHNKVTTEILDASEFYYAEDYHQQYLAKNPNGVCSIKGTGVSCPGN